MVVRPWVGRQRRSAGGGAGLVVVVQRLSVGAWPHLQWMMMRLARTEVLLLRVSCGWAPTGSWTNVVKVWDLTGNLDELVALPGHSERVSHVAWKPEEGGSGSVSSQGVVVVGSRELGTCLSRRSCCCWCCMCVDEHAGGADHPLPICCVCVWAGHGG